MQATDPGAKDSKKNERPESTGKAYERLVEDLFMGDSSDDDDEEEEEQDDEE